MKLVVSAFRTDEEEFAQATVDRMPGGNYQAKFPQWDLTISIARVRARSSGEVDGLLTADVGKAHPAGVIWKGSINLASGGGRKSVAKLLDDRMNGRHPSIPWWEVIENIAITILSAEDAPMEVLALGTLPEPEPLTFLLEPLLVEGHAQVLFGPPDSAKSYLALAACLSIESGEEIIPGCKPRKGRTLYLDWESLGSVADRRWRQLAYGKGIDPPPMRYIEMRTPLSTMASKLAAFLHNEPADLIVIDSAGLAAGIGSDRGDPAETTIKLHATLRELATTALIIDHVPKADRNGSKPASPYGSQYKMALVRHGFEIRATANGPYTHLGLYHAKRSLMAPLPPIGLLFDFSVAGIVHIQGETIVEELTVPLTLAEQIEWQLRKVGHALTTKELSDAMGESQDKLRPILHRKTEIFENLGTGVGWALKVA